MFWTISLSSFIIATIAASPFDHDATANNLDFVKEFGSYKLFLLKTLLSNKNNQKLFCGLCKSELDSRLEFERSSGRPDFGKRDNETPEGVPAGSSPPKNYEPVYTPTDANKPKQSRSVKQSRKLNLATKNDLAYNNMMNKQIYPFTWLSLDDEKK